MVQESHWSHEAELPGELVSVWRVRRFVCVHLVEHRLWHLVDDVRLVASELATNAVRHAKTPFTVRLEQADRLVTLSVRDGSTAAPLPVTTEPLDTAGRGVSIVDIVSDHWGVTHARDGSKSVWASFKAR